MTGIPFLFSGMSFRLIPFRIAVLRLLPLVPPPPNVISSVYITIRTRFRDSRLLACCHLESVIQSVNQSACQPVPVTTYLFSCGSSRKESRRCHPSDTFTHDRRQGPLPEKAWFTSDYCCYPVYFTLNSLPSACRVFVPRFPIPLSNLHPYLPTVVLIPIWWPTDAPLSPGSRGRHLSVAVFSLSWFLIIIKAQPFYDFTSFCSEGSNRVIVPSPSPPNPPHTYQGF